VSDLLDAKVVSELRRKSPDANVVRWFAQRPATRLYLSVLNLGEIRKGVQWLADPTRRLALLDWLQSDLGVATHNPWVN
jgi:predicted nucleic acid-binding protein